MHQAQRAGHFGVEQFLVKVGDLRGQQQAFVDDGARGERGNIEKALLFEFGLRDGTLGALAHDVKFALERILIHFRAALDEICSI